MEVPRFAPSLLPIVFSGFLRPGYRWLVFVACILRKQTTAVQTLGIYTGA